MDPAGYPESPIDPDDIVYPCKGCGEILEEGKAFELAGHRWHIDCFKCNTCGTVLDSDANLLLLGDGSLICNNCTYSCSACGNKIEDLAILTGDQAFCAGCFRCRNCKRKIENLRYARTSQGMFCMECHEGLMARRRKKTKNAASRQKHGNSNGNGNGGGGGNSNGILLDKSLPSLPPNAVPTNAFLPDRDAPSSVGSGDPPAEQLLGSGSARRPARPRSTIQERSTDDLAAKDNLTLPTSTYRANRNSAISHESNASENGDDFFVPMAIDPSIVATPEETSRPGQKENERAKDYFDFKGPRSSSRRPSHQPASDPKSIISSRNSSQPGSPHIAYQEKGREHSSEAIDTLRKRHASLTPSMITGRSRDASPLEPFSDEDDYDDDDDETFRLQEAPKHRRSTSAHGPLREQHPNMSSSSPEAPAAAAAAAAEWDSTPVSTPRVARDSVAAGSPRFETMQPPRVPKRGDSLMRSAPAPSAAVPRKEIGGGKALLAQSTTLDTRQDFAPSLSSVARASMESPSSTYSANVNGGLIIGRPMESPISKSHLDFPPRSKDRPAFSGHSEDTFVSPRSPPEPPVERHRHRGKSASISTLRPEPGRVGDLSGPSPGLPRYRADGDFSAAEDVARTAADNEPDHSLLKRVSNSVRHARSHSDRGVGVRGSREHGRWPRPGPNGSAAAAGAIEEFGSPALSSPDSIGGIAWYRVELRKERQKTAERDDRIAELEAAIEGRTTIGQMNTELREKRSTMVVLDTQKEIVVRELEVLTEHIAASKRSAEPIDLDKLSNMVLREFAEALQGLKDSFAPQIEELMETKNDLFEEIARLTQSKEKAFQEFEQLSVKNSQLADFNNALASQVHTMNRQVNEPGGGGDAKGQLPHGLGIYAQQAKDHSSASLESHMRPMTTETQLTGSTMVHDHDVDGTIMAAPKVVDIRKGQQRKFNWRKGGAVVAKSVGKGLKEAFTSNEGSRSHQDGPIGGPMEGTPYGQMVAQGGEYPSTVVPRAAPYPDRGDASRQGFGIFGHQKQKSGFVRPPTNGNVPTMGAAEDPSVLFGSELEARARHEHVEVPGIIMRCIQEVELRGMDVEGIYRKSGGNSQIQIIKEGFEHSNEFDISDPDLDINAVTSTLKQYFRKLPTPLITYPVYDKLLASTTTASPEDRIVQMRHAIADLPKAHRDCLEFLIFHLARVVKEEKHNLMTGLNCAVVFAPTIMRPESITREMTDTTAKNAAVQFMIENCVEVFLRERNGSI